MRARTLLRIAPLLALAAGLAACLGLSEEEQIRLATLKANSKRFYEAEQFLRAEAACRKGLELDPDDLSLHQVLGFSLLRQGGPQRLMEALAVFERCLDLEDDFDPRTRLGLGETHFQLAKWWDDRIRELRADETLPPDEKERAIAHAVERRDHHFAEGERALRELLADSRGRDDVVAMSALARLLALQGRFAEAEGVLGRMNRILERSLRVRRSSVDASQIPEERRALWERMLRSLEGQLVEGLGLEASVAARLGHWDRTLSAFARLEAMSAMKPADYYNRALAYEAVGSRQAAIENYEAFVRRAAQTGVGFSERVARALERIAALRAGEPLRAPDLSSPEAERR